MSLTGNHATTIITDDLLNDTQLTDIQREALQHWYERTDAVSEAVIRQMRAEFMERAAPWQLRHNEQIRAQTLFVEPVYRRSQVMIK